MENYIKIPIELNKNCLIDIFNTIVKSSPKWDGDTVVESMLIGDGSMKFSFKSLSDKTYPFNSDLVATILQESGMVYQIRD